VRAAMIRERDSSPCSDSDDKKETKLITVKNGCYAQFVSGFIYI
jgi:hypothetical protein